MTDRDNSNLYPEEDWLYYTSFKRDKLRTYENIDDSIRALNPGDSMVFHHTKLKYLALIVDGRQFRLTRYDKMRNDPSEGDFIFDVFKNACNDLCQEMPNDVYSALTSIHPCDTFMEHYFDNKSTEEAIPYIACFTRKQFSDMMRGRYSSDVTITIRGFQNFPNVYETHTDRPTIIRILRVIYGRKNVSNKIKKALQKIISEKCSPEESKRICQEMLQMYRLAVKKTYFEEEYEVRVIFFIPRKLDNHPGVKEMISKTYLIDDDGKELEVVNNFRPGDDAVYVPFPVNKIIEVTGSDRIDRCKVIEAIKRNDVSVIYTSDKQHRQKEIDECKE